MASRSKFNQEISFGKITLTQKAVLAKHLAVMLEAGLTLTEALEVTEDASSGHLRRVLKRVRQSVLAGSPFATALAAQPKVFSGVFVSAVYAGERSGNLSVNLANLARELEKERNLLAKVKGAMLYPAIVLAATVLLGLGIAFFILPKITPLFASLSVDLPFTTRAVIWFADFINRSGFIFLIGLIAAVIILRAVWRLSFLRPFTHWLYLRTPAFGRLLLNLQLTRLAGSLGLLLKAGVNIDEALSISQKTVGNFYYQRALERVASDVGRGLKLSESLERYPELFPLLFTRLVRVGEVSGRFEDTFFYLADFYEDEVDGITKSLATSLEPILLLFIGLVVAGLALSIITPIYELTGNLRR